MAAQKKSNLFHNESNKESSTDLLFDSIRKEDVEIILYLLREGIVDKDRRHSDGYTPLLLACALSRKRIVELLIEYGAKVEGSICPFNRTPLHYAAGSGWTEIVKSIVRNYLTHFHFGYCEKSTSMNVDARDVKGRTALHLASLYGHLEVVKCLVDARAAVDATDEFFETPLHFASSTGHFEVVNFLVDRRADIDARNKSGETALHRASSAGHMEVVKCLVTGGADMEVNSSGTPLLRAARYSCLDVVHLLVNSGADLAFCDKDGRTVLHYAAEHGWIQAAKSIMDRVSHLHSIMMHADDIASCDKDMCSTFHARDINGKTALSLAVCHAHFKVVQCIVGIGVDLNARNELGDTVLHEAIRLQRAAIRPQHAEVIEYLVENGADLNVKNCLGRTPMFVAAELNLEDIIVFLIDSGTDLEIVDKDQCTILHHAAIRTHWDNIAHFLVGKMPDLNVRNKNGETALFQASVCGNLEMVRCLVLEGADMNEVNYSGETPILAAAKRNRKAVVELLANAGANLLGCDANQCTVLHYASTKRWIQTVRILVRRILDLNARNKNGETALFSACIGTPQMDVVTCLLEAGARSDIANNAGRSPLEVLDGRYLTAITCKLFIQAGAYLTPAVYCRIDQNLRLKLNLLNDVKFCCQAVVNKFNAQDLPALYELPVSRNLPRMEIIMIQNGSKVFKDIEESVKFEIMRKEYCNALQLRPISLTLFSVQSILKYYNNKEKLYWPDACSYNKQQMIKFNDINLFMLENYANLC